MVCGMAIRTACELVSVLQKNPAPQRFGDCGKTDKRAHMAIRPLLLTTWTAIRRQARASELAFILIAVGTGAIAGLASAAIGALAHMVQRLAVRATPDVAA